MIVNKEQLKPYVRQRSDLIPLHVWNKQTVDKKGKVQKRGKTPLQPDWTKTPKNTERTLELAKKSYNVGYRIGDEDLIIDIDHRNFSDVDSLKDLCDFLGVDNLADTCPTVITGSGGFHYYLRKPKGVNIRETIDQFPGIEFKTKGRQVVCAGSKHPNGNYYRWDDFSPELGNQPDVDPKLIALLEYVVPENQIGTGTITGTQLTRLLEQLPVDEYDTNDSWFKIMCAAHHGTGGLGIEEFLEWSLNSFDYEEDEHLIRCRWSSLSAKPVSTTINSLYKEVLARGGDTSFTTAKEDFEGMSDFVDDEDVDTAFDDVMSEPTIKTSYKSGLALQLANNLHPSANEEDIITAIRAALQSGTIEQVKAMSAIQTNLKLTKGDLNAIISQIKDQIAEDLGRILAEKTLELCFYKGQGLVFTNNGQYWAYNGTYWTTITKQYVGKLMTDTLDKLRAKVDVKVRENAIVNEALGIMERIVATRDDVLRLRERPHPVINCKNGELWIKKDGTSVLRPHKPKSYLLQLLDVEYSPGSECPLFDKSIREIFAAYEDCEDIVRHFEEYMGFVLHPDKRPAKWFLFKGPGGDGKTTLMKILCGILGDSVLPVSIDKFKSGSSGDNHATETLPGKLLVYDDDLNRNAILPDGTLKQLSEDGELTANPKGVTSFKFKKVCTVTLLSNGYPKTRDLTRGFRRRAMVIPFNRAFHEEGAVLDLAEQIVKTEIAGVLNRALQGLQRLRARGDFRDPKSCEFAKDIWISESNTVALFRKECLIISNNIKDTISLNEAYVAYTDWCILYGIVRVDTKQQFRGTMEDMDIQYGKLAGNKSGFRGVSLVKEEVEDFDGFEDDEDF